MLQKELLQIILSVIHSNADWVLILIVCKIFHEAVYQYKKILVDQFKMCYPNRKKFMYVNLK